MRDPLQVFPSYFDAIGVGSDLTNLLKIGIKISEILITIITNLLYLVRSFHSILSEVHIVVVIYMTRHVKYKIATDLCERYI